MRVWEVCHPHPEVLEGKLQEQDFVVNVGAVWERLELGNDRIHVDERYLDPKKFVERTYFTENMKELISTVARRLRGTNVQAIHHLRVGMGGGKSHTLLLLYYMVSRKEIILLLRDAGVDASLPEDARVVVIDGQRMDPLSGYKALGIKTMWGLLLKLLDHPDYEMYDTWDAVPSVEVLREALSTHPTLILVDELSNYAENVRSDEEKGAKLQIFLQNLTTAIHESPNSILIVATPVGAFEPGYELIADILNRYAEPLVLARGEEYKRIRRRALFQDDFSLLERTVMEIALEMCGEVRKSVPNMSGNCEKSFSDNYPFHPAVDATILKLKSSKHFQEVRDELRFLASLVYSVFKRRPDDAYTILVGHADLRDDYVRGGTIAKLRNPILVARLDQDLEKISEIEDEVLRALTERVYSTIVLNSLAAETPTKRGSTEEEIVFALLTPETPADLIKAAIKIVGQRMWFISLKDNRWVFGEPNLMKVFNEYLDLVDRSPELKGKWWDEIREVLEKAILDKAWKGYKNKVDKDVRIFRQDAIKVWPASSRDVEDDDKPKLIVADYRFGEDHLPRAATTAEEAALVVKDLYENYGDRPRRYKNTVFFLVADRNLVEKNGPVQHAKALLALRKMEENEEELKPIIGPSGLNKVKEMKRDESLKLEQSSYSVYRFLVFPSREGLSAVELGEERRDITRFLYEIDKKLKEDVRKVLNSVDPEALIDKYWPKEKPRLEVSELLESFYQRPELELIIPVNEIKRAIRRAVEQGLLVYVSKGRYFYREDPRSVDMDAVLDREVEEVKLAIKVRSDGEDVVAQVKVGEEVYETPHILAGLKGSVKKIHLIVPGGYKFVSWSDGVKEERREVELREGELVALLKKEEITPEQFELTVSARDAKENKPLQIKVAINGEVRNTPAKYVGRKEEKVVVEIVDTGQYEFEGWADGTKTSKRELTLLTDIPLVAILKPLRRGTRSGRWDRKLEDLQNWYEKVKDYEVNKITIKILNVPPEDLGRLMGPLSMLFREGIPFTYESVTRWKSPGEDISIVAEVSGEGSSFGIFRNYLNQVRDYVKEIELVMRVNLQQFMPLEEIILPKALESLKEVRGYSSIRMTFMESEKAENPLKELVDEFKTGGQ